MLRSCSGFRKYGIMVHHPAGNGQAQHAMEFWHGLLLCGDAIFH